MRLNAVLAPEVTSRLVEQMPAVPSGRPPLDARLSEPSRALAPSIRWITSLLAAPDQADLAELDLYALKADRIAIRHRLGDLVAVIEVVSPGNKSSRAAIRSFVDKAVAFLRQGVHLLIIDLFPPTPRDPQGIHKLIWDEIVEEPFELPADKPLTLAAYSAGAVKAAYIEPVAVDDVLPEMPVFLDPERYVLAPLEPPTRPPGTPARRVPGGGARGFGAVAAGTCNDLEGA